VKSLLQAGKDGIRYSIGATAFARELFDGESETDSSKNPPEKRLRQF
jgi:hypothetical protein